MIDIMFPEIKYMFVYKNSEEHVRDKIYHFFHMNYEKYLPSPSPKNFPKP